MMKKIFVFFLLALNIYAFDVEMASKIFDKIFVALVPQSTRPIYVHTKDDQYIDVLRYAKHLEFVDNIDNANILIVNNHSNIPKYTSIAIFTTNLEIYKKNNNTVGVFYWKHGRPKIVLSKEGLEKFNIKLNRKWNKFVKSDRESSL